MGFFHRVGISWPALPAEAVGLCCPQGIGDISWLVSKISRLSDRIGREIWLTTPHGWPQRSHQLVELLPAEFGIRWAGYTTCETERDVMPLARETDLGALEPGRWHCVEVNRWLELGRPLSEWNPWLGIDYHYQLNIPAADGVRAGKLLAILGAGRTVAVYVSNRDKAKYPDWALWSTEEWAEVLRALSMSCRIGGYVLLGAEYDRDRMLDLASSLGELRIPYVRCLDERFGVAMECVRRSALCLSYPSGIGILANVLRVPAAMLLPIPLTMMADAYADPVDLASGRYRCFTDPEPDEVLQFARGLLA